tara:strand:- start:70 stop:435 length:366 start_codon:yes stop_codon:yes gene_type:complete
MNNSNNNHTNQDLQETSVFNETYGKYIGRVKWFKSKLGYGFITVLCDKEELDIFIHQSNIKTKYSHYRTLKEGEYVSLDISISDESKQAVNITGVYGGPLVCDNKHNIYKVDKDDTDDTIE